VSFDDEGEAPRLRRPPVRRDLSTYSEEALVLQSQAGDRAAFEQLVRRVARLVYSRIYLETRDADRTEDLVQETFLVAWRSVAQVDDPGGFRTWLLTIARSVTNDAFRRASRRKRTGGRSRSDADEAFPRLADPAPAPPDALEQQEEQRRALDVLKSLPEEYRLPITLRYIGGADYDTIKAQLGLSNGSLRGLLHRGMTKLREAMSRQRVKA
jgi:RNA polymerase sigma-70 factor, ECF subfamily